MTAPLTRGDADTGDANTAPSRWSEGQPWLSTAARLGLAVVWLLAGGLKVANTQEAVQAVAAYELLPPALVPIVGFGLPLFEIALGLLLLVGLLTRQAAIASIALLVLFMAGVASAWARGLAIDCGCFGGGGSVAPGKTEYVQELLRDTGFMILAVFVALKPRSRFSVDRRFEQENL